MKLINRRTLLLASVLTPAFTPAFAASIFGGVDTDNDGTISLDEAKAAASAVFDKLDHDHDGTLDRPELRGRISARDWKIADPDNDKTLTKDEYLKYVEVRFQTRRPGQRRNGGREGSAHPCGPRASASVARALKTRDVTRT